MSAVGIAVGVVVGRSADPLVRLPEGVLPLEATEELSTQLVGGRP
jgi:hypothetical protein